MNPTRLFRASAQRAQLQFKPMLVPNGPDFDLQVSIDDAAIVPWGLWGAVVSAASGFAMLVFEGMSMFQSFWMIAIAVTLVGLGAVVARFGPRSSLRSTIIGRVRPHHQTLSLGPNTLHFSQITEIVYAMVRYPLEAQEKSLKVQAFSVLARVGDDVLIPIIEASPDKNEVFAIARAFGAWTGHEVTHVGLGVQNPQ